MEASNPFGDQVKTEDEAIITEETEEVFSQANSKIRFSIGNTPIKVCENPAPKFQQPGIEVLAELPQLSHSEVVDTPDVLKLTSTLSSVIPLNQLIKTRQQRKSVLVESSDRRRNSMAMFTKQGDVSPLPEVTGDSSRVFGKNAAEDAFSTAADVLVQSVVEPSESPLIAKDISFVHSIETAGETNSIAKRHP